MKKATSFLILLFCLIFQQTLNAQTPEEDFIKNTQNDLMIVAAAGGAGAILGLSTLSFVERPSNHIRNVWTGAALGVIAGVIYVAYNSAQKGTEDLTSSVDFNTHERSHWHHLSTKIAEDKNVMLSSSLFHFRF